MNIGIDYDGTYSAAPEMFKELISVFQNHGHKCYLVTARSEERSANLPEETGLEVIWTNQKAKARECFKQCVDIDIWIDDYPFVIHFDLNQQWELHPA